MERIKKRPTIRDIAKLAQTSVATVSWVLNGDSRKYVSDELKQRVLEAAKTLNYRPNLLAQRLKGKSRKLLAIIVPQFENVYFNRIVIGAEKYANSRSYKLLICSTDDDPQKEFEIVNQLIANWVDGFMIAPTLHGENSLTAITQSGIPLVLLDRLISENIDYVAIDNYAAAYTGTKYLLEQGHRQIAYIGWDSDLNTIIDRNKAFFDAVKEYGINREEIIFRRCQRKAEAGYIATNEVLEKYRPTAFFIDQNNIAEGVVQALRDRKIDIPKDISVLLFGDPSWAKLNVPEFTCVALPDIEIGSEGARILIDKIEGRSSGIQTVLLRGSLIERGSIRKL